MNITSFIGVILGGVVFYYGIQGATTDLFFFLDKHAIYLVCGGTLAAAAMSYPLKTLVSLFKVYFLRFLGARKIDYQGTINEILDLNKKAIAGPSALKDAIPGIKHAFLREAVSLVASGMLSEREIKKILDQRLKTTEKRYMEEAEVFKSIGRFPPALGLLATTLGMIGVLQKIGQADSQKLIGPAMSIGLVGTLYGIALANLVFLPIGEALTQMTKEEIALRKIIVEGVVLLKSQANPIAIREALNSHLLPKERVSRKSAQAA